MKKEMKVKIFKYMHGHLEQGLADLERNLANIHETENNFTAEELKTFIQAKAEDVQRAYIMLADLMEVTLQLLSEK